MKELKCPFCQKTIGEYDPDWARIFPGTFENWIKSRIHIHKHEETTIKRETIDELILLVERIEEHYDYKGDCLPEIKKTKKILKNL
jgi:uncharacterized protein (UPF0305 family)